MNVQELAIAVKHLGLSAKCLQNAEALLSNLEDAGELRDILAQLQMHRKQVERVTHWNTQFVYEGDIPFDCR